MKTIVAACLVALLLGPLAAGGEPTDPWKWPRPAPTREPLSEFMRLVLHRNSLDDPGRWIFQTSVRELRHPGTGVSVTLVGMSHVGRPSYFRSLERHLEKADVVLAEGTAGQPPGQPRLDLEQLPEWGRWIRREEDVLARLLGLVRQFEWEARVVDDRWVLADLPTKEMFPAIQAYRTPRARQDLVARLEKLATGLPEEVAIGRKEAADHMMRSLANYRVEEGPQRDPLHVLREGRMWRLLKEAIDKKHDRVAFVSGAEHVYILEARLVHELGFRHYASSWHDVYVREMTSPGGSGEDGEDEGAAPKSLDERVDEWVRTLQAREASLEARIEALGHLSRLPENADRALRAKAVSSVLRTLVAAPPELAVAILTFVSSNLPDPRLVSILVHSVSPHGKTPAVRVTAARAMTRVAGVAALPTLLSCLADEDPRAVEAVESLLGQICWPLPGAGPPRDKWLDFVRTEAGSKLLAAAFVKLTAITKRTGARITPLVDHVAPLVFDEKIPYDAWLAGYRFLRHYVGKEFRPEDLRGQPVEPKERPAIVASIRDWLGR